MFRRVLVSVLALAIVATPALAQQPAAASQSGAHPFGIDDALDVRASRIEDVVADGRWVALTVRVRRDGLGVDNSRYGDPTYITPSPAEFELIDATNGQTRSIFPARRRCAARSSPRTARSSRSSCRRGGGGGEKDDWALNVYDVAGKHARHDAAHNGRSRPTRRWSGRPTASRCS